MATSSSWFRDNSALAGEAPRADNAHPRFSDAVHATVKASFIEPEPGTTLRADIVTLLRDYRDERIAAVTATGLLNATLAAAASDRWHRTAVFGHDVKHVWGLVEGGFGFNLDVVVARPDGGLQRYHRDGSGWHEGVSIDV